MIEEVKLLTAFTIGLGAGILASKRFFQTKYERIANEEIESVRAAISHRSGHILESDSLSNPEEFEKKIEEEMSKPEPKVYSTIDNFYQERAENMKQYINDIKAESEHPEDDRPADVYEITEEEFSETELGFDKEILKYYTDDDLLINEEDGDPDLALMSVLSDEDLDKLRNSNEQELYFRYDQYGTDYDIVRVEGSYYIDM